MAEDLKSKLSEELICQICFEYYKDPKILECLHTFCKDCLMTYVQKQFGDTKDVRVPCPMCRQSTTISSSGVGGLRDNFMLKNLIDMVGESESKEKDGACENCNNSKKAIAKCVECNELLCQACKDAHGLVKVTRGHQIISLVVEVVKPKKEKKRVSKELVCKGSWSCSIHEQEITCFCFHCSRPVCPFCISAMVMEDPTKHAFVGLDDAVLQLKKTVEEKLQSVQEKKGELEEQCQVLNESDQALTESMEKTKTAIAMRAEEIHSCVDKWMSKQEKELEIHFRKNKDEIAGRKSLLEGYLDRLMKGTNEIMGQLKTGDPQILEKSNNLMRQTQVFKDTATFNTEDMPTAVFFNLPKVKDVAKLARPMFTDVSVEKQAPFRRLNSSSSMNSLGDEPVEKQAPRKRVKNPSSSSSAGVPSDGKKVQVHCTLEATSNIPDIAIFGMAVGRYSDDLFVVNPSKREVCRFQIGANGAFQLIQQYGAKALKEPLDVDQLPDGRIVVTDGKEGHSFKIFNLVTGKYEANMAHTVLKKACGIATTSDGNVIVTDVDEKAVYVFKLEGQDKTSVICKIEENNGQKLFSSPQYVASFGKTIIVSDKKRSYVKGFDSDGKLKYQFGQFGSGKVQLKQPEGVCVDTDGRIYIADVQNNRIQILTNVGKHISFVKVHEICGKFDPFPTMLATTKDGKLLLANEAGCIKTVDVQFRNSAE